MLGNQKKKEQNQLSKTQEELPSQRKHEERLGLLFGFGFFFFLFWETIYLWGFFSFSSFFFLFFPQEWKIKGP